MSASSEIVIDSKNGPYRLSIAKGAFAEMLSAGGDRILVADSFFSSLTGTADVPTVFIDATEDNKTVSYGEGLLAQLKEHGARRDTEIVALGGGVVQDLATFVAALYMRGLRWTYVPTTLMAMADSCVGGKSSLNVGRFKNLAGTFHPPVAIAIDPLFLTTLQPIDVASGLAEAAKIAYCRGATAFDRYLLLCQPFLAGGDGAGTLLHHVLTAKKWFVEVDEFDRRERRLLNFGHTFGHAIEAATSFRVPHGVAVALGIACAVRLSGVPVALNPAGRLAAHCRDLLAMVPDLPVRLDGLDDDVFERAFRSDKKHSHGEIHVVLPLPGGGVEEVTRPADAASMAAVRSALWESMAELGAADHPAASNDRSDSAAQEMRSHEQD